MSLTIQANVLLCSWCGQTGLLATIFSALAALLIKTRLDSCHVLSAGWLAAVYCPFCSLIGKKEGFSWLQLIISQMQKPPLHDDGGAGLLRLPFSGVSVKAEIKWAISPVSHAGFWPGLWVI